MDCFIAGLNADAPVNNDEDKQMTSSTHDHSEVCAGLQRKSVNKCHDDLSMVMLLDLHCVDHTL